MKNYWNFLIAKVTITWPFLKIGTSGWRCSRSPVAGQLATTLVATKNVFIFFFPPRFSPFLRRHLFSEKEGSDQKTNFAKFDGSAQKHRGRHFSRPCGINTLFGIFSCKYAFFYVCLRKSTFSKFKKCLKLKKI